MSEALRKAYEKASAKIEKENMIKVCHKALVCPECSGDLKSETRYEGGFDNDYLVCTSCTYEYEILL